MNAAVKRILRWVWPLLAGFVVGIILWITGCHTFGDTPPPPSTSGLDLMWATPEPVRVIEMRSCQDARQDLVTVDWQPPADEYERFCACIVDGTIAEIGEARARTLEVTGALRVTGLHSGESPPPDVVDIMAGLMEGCLNEFTVPPPWG